MDQRETTFGRTENDDSRTEKGDEEKGRHAAEVWLGGGSGSLGEISSRQFALMREIERGRTSERVRHIDGDSDNKRALAGPIVKTAGLDAPPSNHHHYW